MAAFHALFTRMYRTPVNAQEIKKKKKYIELSKKMVAVKTINNIENSSNKIENRHITFKN